MRLPIVSSVLAAACALGPVAVGHAPALAQDFSITNQVEPASGSRRDVMRQLQAWWDSHAYYPRHAANGDEGGTVKLRLLVHPDGNIWVGDVVGSSGSQSLDVAAAAAFRGVFVRPLADGTPDTGIDLSLHYVLAHRHDQPVPADYKPSASPRRPFTITNDPVHSPILDTMLQRTCTGTIVRNGIRNHPAYGVRYWAQAVFFRRPDGSPWVKFYENGYSILAPVTEVGKVVQWTGREEHLRGGASRFSQYTAWADGENNLIGDIDVAALTDANIDHSFDHGGTVDFACASETVPAIKWDALAVNTIQKPPGDPP